jgi:hypothetical protein
MPRHVIAVAEEFQIVRPSQIRHKLLIRIRLRPAQLVVEMNDGENNPQLMTKFEQQTQQRNRIDPAGDSYPNPVPGMQQFLPPNVGQHALCKCMHSNMVQPQHRQTYEMALQRPCSLFFE